MKILMVSVEIVLNFLFYWTLYRGALEFFIWRERYRAARQLQKNGLLYLALAREALARTETLKRKRNR